MIRMITKRPLLLVICGPTATGKTDMAVSLARYFNTEVISADSRQFYREMKIGTAVPTEVQRLGVPHHFIGNLSIHDPYNVYQFEDEVLNLLSRLFSRHPVVIMAGGSGLYINAVCYGIDRMPDPDPDLRAQLKAMLDREGIASLQNMLETLDPVYFKTVDRSNPVRLIRAIEVCRAAGVPYSSLRGYQKPARPFHIVNIGINLPRTILYQRINSRVEVMMQAGLLDEVRTLFEYRNLSALNTVGYRELFEYLEGIWSIETAVEKIKTNTRRYAKRQITWFTRDKTTMWFDPTRMNEIISMVENSLEQR